MAIQQKAISYITVTNSMVEPHEKCTGNWNPELTQWRIDTTMGPAASLAKLLPLRACTVYDLLSKLLAKCKIGRHVRLHALFFL
jgi:hypothetical protein